MVFARDQAMNLNTNKGINSFLLLSQEEVNYSIFTKSKT